MASRDGVELTFDRGQIEKRGRQVIGRITDAGARAVAEATKGLERKLEAATQAAVPGRLWKAWASRFYPNRQVDAAGSVYVKGGIRSRGAITYWTRPGEVRAKNGRYLAVPLPAAGRSKTPAEWENAHNTDLEFVLRPGKTALLVAETGGLTSRGNFRRLSLKALKAGRRGKVTVPIFVLIRVNKFRNAVAVEPLVAASERELVASFIAATR